MKVTHNNQQAFNIKSTRSFAHTASEKGYVHSIVSPFRLSLNGSPRHKLKAEKISVRFCVVAKRLTFCDPVFTITTNSALSLGDEGTQKFTSHHASPR